MVTEWQSVHDRLIRSRDRFLEALSLYDTEGRDYAAEAITALGGLADPDKHREELYAKGAVALGSEIREFVELRIALTGTLGFVLAMFEQLAASASIRFLDEIANVRFDPNAGETPVGPAKDHVDRLIAVANETGGALSAGCTLYAIEVTEALELASALISTRVETLKCFLKASGQDIDDTDKTPSSLRLIPDAGIAASTETAAFILTSAGASVPLFGWGVTGLLILNQIREKRAALEERRRLLERMKHPEDRPNIYEAWALGVRVIPEEDAAIKAVLDSLADFAKELDTARRAL